MDRITCFSRDVSKNALTFLKGEHRVFPQWALARFGNLVLLRNTELAVKYGRDYMLSTLRWRFMWNIMLFVSAT